MALYFIGLGLTIEHLSIGAINVLRRCSKIYVDSYTNIVPDFSLQKLKEIIGDNVNILLAERKDLEGENIRKIIEEASIADIAILVPGDPFIATTHDAIRLEALEKGIEVHVIHGVSIYSVAPSATGLQAYKFGKTVTLVYPRNMKPYTTIEVIRENKQRGLHTLVLLDLKLEENIAMTINEAVDILITLENEYCKEYNCKPILANTLAVGCAQLGTRNQFIRADYLYRLKEYKYPDPPHSIIIVGKTHPIELDILKYIGKMPDDVYKYFSSLR
ncbi:diphthine synthase [Desulfurococcaceae archaeon MEX13E-LK6-19]|nr:diphthine synthase [Desulfurococcaceae archaeon MEX13E-LK6-19]